jgi:hypothetical protein
MVGHWNMCLQKYKQEKKQIQNYFQLEWSEYKTSLSVFDNCLVKEYLLSIS